MGRFVNGVEMDGLLDNPLFEVVGDNTLEYVSERTGVSKTIVHDLYCADFTYAEHKELIDADYIKKNPYTEVRLALFKEVSGLESMKEVENITKVMDQYEIDVKNSNDNIEAHYLCEKMECKSALTEQEASRFLRVRKDYLAEYYKADLNKKYENLSDKPFYMEYMQEKFGYGKEFIQKLESTWWLKFRDHKKQTVPPIPPSPIAPMPKPLCKPSIQNPLEDTESKF